MTEELMHKEKQIIEENNYHVDQLIPKPGVSYIETNSQVFWDTYKHEHSTCFHDIKNKITKLWKDIFIN